MYTSTDFDTVLRVASKCFTQHMDHQRALKAKKSQNAGARAAALGAKPALCRKRALPAKPQRPSLIAAMKKQKKNPKPTEPYWANASKGAPKPGAENDDNNGSEDAGEPTTEDAEKENNSDVQRVPSVVEKEDEKSTPTSKDSEEASLRAQLKALQEKLATLEDSK